MPGEREQRYLLTSGGTGDIGRAILTRFLADGWQVTDLSRRAPDMAGLPDDLRAALADQRLTFIQSSVTDRAAVRRAIDAMPQIDAFVGNAGISRSAPFLEITDEEWNDHLATNLTGNFIAGQEAARAMVRQGRPGSIVFTSSWVGEVPWPEIAAYTASKGGLQMLMKNMALELAAHGIRVNAVAPGIVRAGMAKYQMDHEPQYAARIQGIIPLGRLQEPADVANAIAFLCGDEAAYITGTTLLSDGGASLFNYGSGA